MEFKLGKDEYLIDCDNNMNIVLKQKSNAKKIVNKVETDEYVYNVLGYFNNLGQTLKFLLNYLVKNKAKEKHIDSIKEIITTINECNELLVNTVKDIVL